MLSVLRNVYCGEVAVASNVIGAKESSPTDGLLDPTVF